MPIVLLTDFGTKDHFAGAMKGAILTIAPDAVIVDITHEVPPQDLRSAAFILGACYRDFPSGTVFVCVVDPAVGSERKAIVVETADRFFVAPDNGLLSFVIDENAAFGAFELSNSEFFAPEISRTFHGRDIFAPVAAHLSRGVKPEEFGTQVFDLVRLARVQPEKISDGELRGAIIHIDRFGNLITNLVPSDLPGRFVLTLNGKTIMELRETYAGAVPGIPFLIPGSSGFIEISVNGGSAANLLAAATGQTFIFTAAK